jgi:hypothetical protein
MTYITVRTAKPRASYHRRTDEEIQSEIAERFGGVMPSPAVLAAMENRAAKCRNGNANWNSTEQAKAANAKHIGQRGKRGRHYSVDWEARRKAVIAALPAQSVDVAVACCISKDVASEILRMMLQDGLVKRDRKNGSFVIWDLA